MFRLCVSTHFDAAHHLRNYLGKCANQHGHRFSVQIYFVGEQLDSRGILVDFKDIKLLLKPIVDSLDHSDLNTLPPFDHINPTAENLAEYIYKYFLNTWGNHNNATLEKVRVYESPDAFCEYWE